MPKAEPRPEAVFTIPATAPFLTSLARAILAGDLPRAGGAPPVAHDLAGYTILLPTRRAARALQTAFLSLSENGALLLPRIAALGAPDEDEYLLSDAEEAGAGADFLEIPPEIGAIEREIALTRLVLEWQDRRTVRAGAEPDFLRGAALVPTASQAHGLAVELARLMDLVEAEGADLKRLDELVPAEFTEHWQLTLEFLSILTERWPEHLTERGLMSPVARRNLLTEAWAARLTARTDGAPVIAAGSTGTLPATANLLAAIGALPNGAVVLPGLDHSLDETSWKVISRHPEHPQHSMALLLRRMGVSREDVCIVKGAEPEPARRIRLGALSEALRPAATTERWSAFATPHDSDRLAKAFDGVSLIAAPSPQDEAEIVALILRQALETPNQTAALVTPDRALARRVASRLSRWGLRIDDSAGRAVVRTPPGAFLDHVIDAAASNFGAVQTATLLKHPLTRLGFTRLKALDAARTLELTVLRRVLAAHGLPAFRQALATARDDQSARRGLHPNGRRAAAWGVDAALQLIDRLESAFAPLRALISSGDKAPLKDFLTSHVAAAEALAQEENGLPDALWQGEAGEALALRLADVLSADHSGLMLGGAQYPAFYRSLVSATVVRPRAPGHPRVAIWGPLEARLQQPDVLVLGGLNEGVWPRVEDAGPWLNRPMCKALGLSAPERRIGLAAHDFVQGAAAARVYLTRAEKSEGAPTIPSRWLLRLAALLEGAGAKNALEPDLPWLAWARARDDAPASPRRVAPAPCPPVHARPTRMSVSGVQRWMANPYAVFAQNIMRLEPMPELGKSADAAMRGELIHIALNRFATDYPATLPDDIETVLMRHAHALFAEMHAHPAASALWLPQFERFARWFAATEPRRRARVVSVHSEVCGAVELKTLRGFQLTARADRIDIRADGSAAIYDYKSGGVPKPVAVDELYAPQLPLEAAIAARGGFEGLAAVRPASLAFIRATGRGDGGEEQEAGRKAAADLGERAFEELTTLAKTFESVDTPYRALRRSVSHFKIAYDYDEYAHLARIFVDDEEEAA